jgi:hypothetical protein
MPSVLRIKGYRFFFYSNEGTEPMHIHVEKGDDVAKFWLDPIELDSSYGFNASEVNKIRKMVIENAENLIKAWNEHIG